LSLCCKTICDPKIHPDHIISEADEAMYEAKKQGKNRIVMRV
jgi:PleD family two-component response regulator